jgi:hypothetical protein
MTSLLVMTTAATAAAIAAPVTASASAGIPKAVGFERAAPAAQVEAAAHGHHTLKGTLRTGRHFNLVGLRWRGDAASSLAIRVRAAGHWGRWTTVPVDPEHGPDVGAPEARTAGRTSDPVWAGQANAVQYALRGSGTMRDVRLAFLNTEGTATAAERRHEHRHDRRQESARASAARPIVPAPGVPPIITREEWGASQCPPRAAPTYGDVQVAFVHHTVSANNYGPADSAAMVRGICLYHRNSNHWNDIGYNFLVDKYGQVFEGRAGGIDAAVVGAQAQGYNAQSTGISNLGTFSTTGQTPAGLDALARLLSWKLAVHAVPPLGTVQVTSTGGSLNRYPAGAKVTLQRISGHRDGDATACPGDALYAQLPQLRQMVTGGPLPVRASLAFTATSSHITYGAKAAFTARLTGPGGAAVPGQQVDVQLLGRSGAWSTLHSLKTDFGGGTTTNIRLTYNHVFRARFAGFPGLSGAQSKPVSIGVRPRISARLKASAATVIRPGTRVIVEGKVKPAKRTALLLVDRLGPSDKRRVGKRVVRVRSGRARASFLFERRGRYALRFAVVADAQNLSARSDPVSIRVR